MPFPRRLRELYISVAVPLAIALLGVYDYVDGSPPSGLLGLPDWAGLGVFLIGCLLVACIGSTLQLAMWTPTRPKAQLSIVLAALLPVLSSDPTYASLIIMVPLVDIRRQDDEPIRSALTGFLTVIVVAALVFENTRRASNDLEVAVGLGVALLAVILLGDALRTADQGLALEAEVAKLSERNRLAQELHDSLGHHLLAASIQLEKAKSFQESDRETTDTSIEYAAGAIAEAISETRVIVDGARPTNEAAIEPAIRELVGRIAPARITMDLAISGRCDDVNARAQMAIYRVTQEALTNLVRHSQATESSITITATEYDIRLSIDDNGTGFEANVGQLNTKGLGNMSRRIEELGGILNVSSSTKGTAISARVPR